MIRYGPALIEEVKSRLDIAAVAGQYVKLKRRGQNSHVGLCPFHSENTPSFTVNGERQTYKCFGCDAGGDVFAFVQEIEQVPFSRALRICADIAGVSIDDRQQESGPTLPTYRTDLLGEAELWRVGLLWRIERALPWAKTALWTDRHKDAVRTTRRLTKQLAEVRKWTPRECVDKARLANPALVRACVDEAREFETLLATIIAAAGGNNQLEAAA